MTEIAMLFVVATFAAAIWYARQTEKRPRP